MLAILLLFLFFVFGTLLVHRIFPRFHIGEMISCGYVVGSTFGTWIIFLLSSRLTFSYGVPIAVAVLGGAIGLLLRRESQTRFKFLLPSLTKNQRIWFCLYTLICGGILFSLFRSHMMFQKADGIYTGGGSYGDLALHSTFTYKFAQGDRVHLVSPIYAQEQTTYPFLIDFYSGLLLRYGLSLQEALFYPGFFASLAITQLIFFFSMRLFRSVIAATFTAVIFLANGGIGVVYFIKDYLVSDLPLLEFLVSMKVEYAHLADFNLRWSNIIADYFLPQRGFVAGLAIFLCALIFLHSLWNTPHPSKKQFILFSLLTGALPFFHIHTFLVLCGIFGWIVLTKLVQTKKIEHLWITTGLLILLFALPQLYWQFSQTLNGQFLRIQPGWMKANENILVFWLRNMGAGLLFFTASVLYSIKHRKKHGFVFSVLMPLTLLFLVANVIVFQPHDYDNMKFMLYSYFFVSVVSGYMLAKIWHRHLEGKALVCILLSMVSITGVLSIFRESYTSWMIANTADITLASQIRERTPPESIFLTADRHNHPASMLAGRSIVMGFRGWLWTHGVNYSQTERDVKAMFAGTDESISLMKKYNIDYVFIGSAEEQDFQANTVFFDSHFPVIATNDSGTVYSVKDSINLL